MRSSLSRREFLGVAGVLAAVAIAPGLASGAMRRRRLQPATYFELVEAGRALRGQVPGASGLGKSVRILMGSAGGASNSLVYVTDAGSLLVDVATAPLGLRMVRDAEMVGGPVGEIAGRDGFDAVVVNTHHHADHTGGNWALSAVGPRPRVVMHVRADERVRGMVERYVGQASGGIRAAGQVDEARRGMAQESAEGFAAMASELQPEDFAAIETFDADVHEVRVGEGVAMLHHFGAGHTDNDTVVHLPEENVVHCGDLLFSRMHPYFADDSGARSLGWAASVGRIIELCDDKTVVVPGHGPVCDVGELRRQRAYLEQLWDAVEIEVAKGTTREVAAQMSWPFMEGLERDQIRARAIGAVYDEVVAGR